LTPIVSATLLRTQSDARLAALARAGGPAGEVGARRAFEAIVERYRGPLHRYCRRMLPDSRAEDVVQQAFLKAWSSLQEGAEIRDLRPWLYRITHNAALDALKKAGYDYEELTEVLQSAGTPDADFERRVVMRETLAGVAALPERQREALLRTAVEGQSREQVAHDLGLSDGAVRQLVHRARTTLRAAATAITPLPLVQWLASAGGTEAGPVTQRVTELVAGTGAAGAGSTLLKGGAVVVAAGALVGTPVAVETAREDPARGEDRREGQRRGDDSAQRTARRAAEGAAAVARAAVTAGPVTTSRRPGGSGEDRSGPSGSSGPTAVLDNSGPGSLSSGSGSGTSGSGSSGSGSSGSGSDSSGSGSSGSGTSGSDSSGSGSSGSGSDTSGSGTSGSGTSGSSGSGTSGSG
jgi:RNA polymerase sigma factor (sigma-70 family)